MNRATPAVFALAFFACQQPPPQLEGRKQTQLLLEGPGPDAAPTYTRIDDKLNERRVVAPRPSLKDQEAPEMASLTGRASPDERATVGFALQHTRVTAKVSGSIARVEVMQLYKNPTADRLEAVYAFPLPANAAVTDMYFRIGKRIVYSEVQKKQQAKQTYEAAKAEGKTAALTEQERPNLFTQSVANIPPGETVAVVIRYVHEVPLDDGRYQFVFPTTIGPRYNPSSVADADKVSPPTTQRSAADVDISVSLVPGVAFADVASKAHQIITGLDGDGARLVALDEDDESRRPNKDFVLSWAPAGAVPTAHAVTEADRGERYVMMMVQPPAHVDAKTVRPKEMVFLIDTSCSMGGQPLDTAKAVINKAMDQMGPEDTFQLIAFASGTEQMSQEPLLNSATNVAAAKQWLARMQGNGGTEMMGGIRAALSPPADPKRLRMVVFATDGFIGNETEILMETRKHRDQARVFGFGIGSSVNRFLLEGMGREGRGATDIVGIDEKVDVAVERLYRRLDRPVLTDLKLSFEGMEVTDTYPAALPDLMAGQPLVVVGKLKSGKSGKAVLEGRYAGSSWKREIPVEVSERGQTELPVLGTLWARRKIDHLSFEEPSVDAEHEAAITELGLRFKLITSYTSFVAVERELLVDPKVPLTTMLVPNEMPEGVSFGDGATTEVLPSRVKPGDPEVRVKAGPTARAVQVKLPFEANPRDAMFDAASGEYVLRFLVPSGFPDGSYELGISITHEGGGIEERVSKLRVDTRASSIVVVGGDATASAGKPFTLHLKPALALGELTTDGDALKAAMEVKEVLVHAPWGETVMATFDGPLGLYTATVHVPEDVGASVRLELVASDAAGNVSRRAYAVPTSGKRFPAVFPVGAVMLLGLMLKAVIGRRKATQS